MERQNSGLDLKDKVVTFNCMTLCVSILLISVGLSGQYHLYDPKFPRNCDKYIHTSSILFGAIMFIVSIMGILGEWSRNKRLLGFHLLALCLPVVAMISFTVSPLVAATKDGGKLLQKCVTNAESWEGYKSCLVLTKICSSAILFARHNRTSLAETDQRWASLMSSTKVVASHRTLASSSMRAQPFGGRKYQVTKVA